MIENPNRRDVLTKGSALIVASGAVLSASPGKTQEGSTEPGFVRFGQARALYAPHSDSPPFGLGLTTFPKINLVKLFENSRDVNVHPGVQEIDVEKFTPTIIVGIILQASSQGSDGYVGNTLEPREGRSIEPSSDFLKKSKEILNFFTVPTTDISLAENMERGTVSYITVSYMDVRSYPIFVESDQRILVLLPIIFERHSIPERQCSFREVGSSFFRRLGYFGEGFFGDIGQIIQACR